MMYTFVVNGTTNNLLENTISVPEGHGYSQISCYASENGSSYISEPSKDHVIHLVCKYVYMYNILSWTVIL